MRDLQAKHKEWCERNFGGRASDVSPECMLEVGSLAGAVGHLAHHALKSYQGIRGDFEHHVEGFSQAKRMLGVRLAYTNAPEKTAEKYFVAGSIAPILGIVEEVGELVRASLYVDLKDEQVDAVGDIALYLLDFCNKAGIDFEDAVRTTAAKVHARDWNVNQVNGEVSE